jgi:hypothetical protein
MKQNVDQLAGKPLVWAVCHALGHAPEVDVQFGVCYRSDHGSWVYPRYTDDSEVGSLMSSEWIGVDRPSSGQATPMWRAITNNKVARGSQVFDPVKDAWGETIGIAVCRALVLSRVGPTIDVPDILLSSVAA